MKRNIIFLLMVIFVLSLVACEAPKDKTGSKVTYDIVGTKDFYVQINDTQVDFLEGVTAEGSDDSINAPQVDSSNIDFTKAGKYELVYSYKEAPVVTCYVYVYDEPEFVIAEGSEVLTLEYDEVSNSLLNGITAKDSFDNALEVVIVDYKGLFNGDGSANYGSFDIVYSAEDRVGNVAIQERKVVVAENTEAAPQILNSENLLFDVVDENITLEIDIKSSSQVLISIDANIVEYEIVENNYVIDTTVLFSDLSLSDHVIRVVTEKGYDEAAFTLVDNQEPIYNAEGLNNWYFEVNKAGVLPVVEKANANQRYELFYSLKDANNNLISIENNEFVPETVGEYTYTIDFKREDSIVKTESFTYTVYDSETYEKIVDLANSKQFLGATIVPMGGKVKVDFFADSIGGRENVYKITMAQSTPISEWYDRIEVKNIKEKAEVYYSLNFDMYFEGNVTPRFGIKGGDSFWLHETGSQGVVNMYLNGAKTTSIPNQQWFTVEIVVSQVDITKATVEALTMMFGDNDAGTIAYLSNMRFIDFSEYVADFTGFNNWIFKAEEENALPSFNRVQGAQHTYEFTSVPEGATNPGILNTANFNFATPGEYEYTYTVSYAGNAYSKNLSLTVYSAEDYNKIADSANSMQFFKQNLVIGSGGMKLDYHDEAIGGRQGAYKVTIAPGATTANQWYNRIEYNKENTEFKEKMTTYPILSMDFYLEQGADIGFIIKGSPTLKFTDSRIKLFVDGEMVSAIPYGKWFTAEITISSFTSEYNTSPLNIVCASPNKVFYINNVKLLAEGESIQSLNFLGLNNWIYEANIDTSLPKVEGSTKNTYTFTSAPEGASNPGTLVDVDTYTFETPGLYEFGYSVVLNNKNYSKNLSLTVYSSEDYYKIADAGNSMQFFKQNLVIGSGGMIFDYYDGEIGGRQGAYKVTIAPAATTANQWYNRIEYNKEDTEFKEKMTTYPIIRMDLYLEEGVDIGFTIKGSSTLKLTDGRIKMFVDGQNVTEIPYGVWFTVEITISSFTSEYNTSPLNIVCASANKVFYINDVVMLTQEESLMNQQ